MKKIQTALLTCIALFSFSIAMAQNPCRVVTATLAANYQGECKDGLASGKGEASGAHRYTGEFKKGMPDGKGSYYYNDSMYYIGNFEAGIREGKGEMHYLRPKGDSMVKGYWSGDVYRGKRYTTYSFNTIQVYSTLDISPMGENDNTLTIEVTTNTGSPDGTIKHSLTSATGPGMSITDLISLDGEYIRKKTNQNNGRMASVTYEILKFPARLQGTFSSGRTFELELYKAARWRMVIGVNE